MRRWEARLILNPSVEHNGIWAIAGAIAILQESIRNIGGKSSGRTLAESHQAFWEGEFRIPAIPIIRPVTPFSAR